jgi:lipopolysaccharide biosynthesis glycosyltransferase
MNKNVYIGYDTREDIAYQVSKFSILNKSENITINPLKLSELKDKKLYWRDEDKLGSTEFTFSRFLVPELNEFNGWALFCDCDILFLEDLNNLFELADDKYAVMCVQHDYKPKEGVKMDGKAQTLYPRKNWSSLVLWNCSHPSNKTITKELINQPDTTGKYLHRFSWLKDNEIGSLPHHWNWLAGWYKEPQDGSPKAIHYTEGGPWFENYRHCEYHQQWKNELHQMMNNSK